ncbi:MAG TPA: sigma-70 family RNA polymerase sigma factor [Phycisphaerae bacterium]|nr:sigma-70 family RNA polymerase sigma factor [Phycisphaerae bacterium]
MEDSELLKAYLDTGSTEAFDKLMSRHIDLVYSAARRQVRDEHLAQDVTQAVFILLAQKAHSVRSGAALPGWLVLTTYYASRDARKLEIRRRLHELKAAQMNLTRDRNHEEAAWDSISPELDAALASLNSKHRNIVAMHFMEGRTFREVGATLGISEDAARLSCARALHKLRRTLAGRGAVVSAAALSSMIASQSAHATPVAVHSLVAAAATNTSSIAASAHALLIARRVARTLEIARATFVGGTALTAVVVLSLGVLAVATGIDKLKDQPATLSLPPVPDGLAANFHPGGRVELVAISRVSDSPRTWWAPDGSTPLATPNHSAPITFQRTDLQHRDIYEFAFRVTNLTPNAHDLWVSAAGEPHGLRGVLLNPNQRDEGGLVYASAPLPIEQTSTNICVALSTGGWYSATLDASGNPISPSPKGMSCLLPAHVMSRDGQSVICLPTDPYSRYDYEAVAVDTAGDEHPISNTAPRFIGDIGPNAMTAGFVFDLPLEKVSNFQVSIRQSRHFIVFRHITLRAGVSAAAYVEASVPLCEPDKAVYDTDYLGSLSQLSAAIQARDIDTATRICDSFAIATHKRATSLQGTPYAYLVPLGQPVLDQLSQALHSRDLATASQLLSAETPAGNNLWQLTHQLATVMPVTSLEYP